jgi:hypothetical protein
MAVSIFPNPASNILNISGMKGSGFARIIDMNGKEVINAIQLNSNTQQIDISQIPDGNYMLLINGNSAQSASRFCILR